MATLGKRIQSLREKSTLTKVEFGKIAGVSGVTVGKWEQGKIIPRDNKIELLAKHFGLTFEELRVGSIQENDESNIIHVPLIDETGEKVDTRCLDRRLLPGGVSKSLVLIQVSGDSMESLFPDRSLALIDKLDTNIKDGKVYALQNKQFILIRKLSYTSGGVRQQTLNDGYRDELLTFQEMDRIKVLGRVVASYRTH